mmetsp:Transcript_91341/g.257934  ORF Transcript_91341/g.257934 Transcript_91341/m.257934 type:complete len:267 (+) Transcript_91341:71-871(+)
MLLMAEPQALVWRTSLFHEARSQAPPRSASEAEAASCRMAITAACASSLLSFLLCRCARSNAVWPLEFLWAGSAPIARSASTMFACPSLAASWRGYVFAVHVFLAPWIPHLKPRLARNAFTASSRSLGITASRSPSSARRAAAWAVASLSTTSTLALACSATSASIGSSSCRARSEAAMCRAAMPRCAAWMRTAAATSSVGSRAAVATTSVGYSSCGASSRCARSASAICRAALPRSAAWMRTAAASSTVACREATSVEDTCAGGL